MSDDEDQAQDIIEYERLEATTGTVQESVQIDQERDYINDQIRQEIALLRQERLEIEQVRERDRALADGTFFSTLNQVWTTGHQELHTFHETDAFVRRHHVVFDEKKYYEKTVDAARKSDNDAADSSVVSRLVSEKVDIFGVRAADAHSVHLLPYASTCATYWFSIVPWVLFTGTVNLLWAFLQKCIHGSLCEQSIDTSKETAGNAKQTEMEEKAVKKKAAIINQESQSVPYEQSIDTRKASAGKATQTKKENKVVKKRAAKIKQRSQSIDTRKATVGSAKQTKKESKVAKKKAAEIKQKKPLTKKSSNNSNGTATSKQRNVGIKHFSTNQIRLADQATYFDDHPCVIIVPIMSVEEVRSWNGGEYNAIVLAGDWKKFSIDAAHVYTRINATRNMRIPIIDATGNEKEIIDNDCLANEEQCSIACHLLRQMTLCVCKSVKDSTYLHKEMDDTKYKEWKSAVEQLSRVPVPVSNGYSTETKVRKISFSKCTATINPAPDPLLLLAKATSNWLTRHQIEILPACGDTDSCSDFISISEEAEIRGWLHIIETEKKPQITGVDIHIDMDVVDEPLTDDES